MIHCKASFRSSRSTKWKKFSLGLMSRLQAVINDNFAPINWNILFTAAQFWLGSPSWIHSFEFPFCALMNIPWKFSLTKLTKYSPSSLMLQTSESPFLLSLPFFPYSYSHGLSPHDVFAKFVYQVCMRLVCRIYFVNEIHTVQIKRKIFLPHFLGTIVPHHLCKA